MSKETYHIPVLLNNCIEGLNIKPDGIYVDLTFGGGGHSREILKHLSEKGKLYAFDQDEDAQQNVPDDPRFVLIPQNFRYIKNYLRLYGVAKVDGILGDLGVSSHQFDSGERGFSIRFEGNLDMRMNQKSSLSAAEVVNEYSEEKLTHLLKEYGELPNAKKLASAICQRRTAHPIKTTDDLKDSVKGLYPSREEHKYLAKLFQAIRIEVNQEMESLKECLQECIGLLHQGGRLVVISYHSLEDRLVKNLMKTGNTDGVIIKDQIFGKQTNYFKLITTKPIIPTVKEMELNSRSRSAKLRIAEKL